MNWALLGISTEHALFGLNHSATIPNRIGLAPSDGLLFAADADGNVSATATSLRDYAVYRGGSNAIPAFMITDGTTFGPTPPLGDTFDNLNAGIATTFPSKTFAGWGSSPAGSIGLGWVAVEVRQVNNLVTWLLDGKALAQYTNTTAYTAGSVMLGYYDGFSSIGDANSFAVIDNLRVEGISVAPVQILAPTLVSNAFHFSFATEAYEPYTVQRATSLTTPDWTAYTNFVGNGNVMALTVPWNPGQGTYFRVSRP